MRVAGVAVWVWGMRVELWVPAAIVRTRVHRLSNGKTREEYWHEPTGGSVLLVAEPRPLAWWGARRREAARLRSLCHAPASTGRRVTCPTLDQQEGNADAWDEGSSHWRVPWSELMRGGR